MLRRSSWNHRPGSGPVQRNKQLLVLLLLLGRASSRRGNGPRRVLSLSQQDGTTDDPPPRPPSGPAGQGDPPDSWMDDITMTSQPRTRPLCSTPGSPHIKTGFLEVLVDFS